MAGFLLDTNILSDLMRNPAGRAAARLRRVGQGDVCTSVIVSGELRYGAQKKRSRQLANHIETVLAGIEVLPFEPPADQVYAEVRARLKRSGKMIGANDFLIAAHALSLGCTLVTANEREFSRVEGLQVENWLR